MNEQKNIWYYDITTTDVNLSIENTKSIFQFYKQKQISLHNLFLFSSPNKTYNLLGDSTLGGSSEMIQVNLEIKFEVLIQLIIQLNTIQVNLG